MDKDIEVLIWKPYNLDILSLIDGKRNIQEITKQAGLTYKSVLLRLNELEKAGIIEQERADKPGDSNKIYLSSKYQGDIKDYLTFFYEIHKNNLKDILKDVNKKKDLIDVLTFLKENRAFGGLEFLRVFSDRNHNPYLVMDLRSMEYLGLIKRRFDITKKGIALLKELKEARI